MASILWVPATLAAGTYWLYLLSTWGKYLTSKEDDLSKLTFPNTIEDLKNLAVVLKEFHSNNSLYVVTLFCSAYLYKQSFAIPGSALLNVLAGAVFGLWWGFPLVCFLTAMGASSCFLLSKHFGKDYVSHYFPSKVAFLQEKVAENSQHLPYFLLFLRLFPMTPNWFLNIASPLVNIPLPHFFLSVFFGLMPYNFICVQAGALISSIKSLDSILTTGNVLKLVAMAVAVLLPSLFFKVKQKSS